MIREANKTDSINLAALSIQVWLHTYASGGIRKEISSFVLDTFTTQYFDERINSPDYRILVFIRENHLIGYILVNLGSFWQENPSHGYEIDKLYVQEHHQGNGIGRQLVLEAASKYGGAFWLSTWIDNTKAIQFYKHIGFKDIGHTFFELSKDERHENRVLQLKVKQKD